MQGRSIGSPRTTKISSHAPRKSGRPTPSSDAITMNSRTGRDHGSRTALVRSILSMTLLAGGLSAVLLNAGTDFGRAEASTKVSDLAMPKPRLQALAPEMPVSSVLAASASFHPVGDLDTELGTNTVDRVSYDFLLSQTSTGDPNDILEFGPMKIRRHLVQTIVKAAQAVQTDPVLLMAVADKESSFITAVQAKTSSATGLFQFIERTWLGVIRDFGPRYGYEKEAGLIVPDGNDRPSIQDQAERSRILDLRRDPYLSAVMAGEMLKRDAGRIALKIGRELTLGEVYLAHFLGPEDAENFLSQVVDKPTAAAATLLPGPARANRSIFFAGTTGRGRHRKPASLSVAQVHQKFEAMMNARGDRYRDVRTVAGLVALADAETVQ
ncbi:putative transglycosylase [Methylorubrum extorquens]|uniref:Putative transglycosylase n=1 Tax=Methylorubrum extorquens TaxID=408 RepID=A0A2N9ARF4_METEX|nr:transglycosylase SLT domain-containing protein [Methylorubrum zatmanii]ARO56228.1 transglycosylase SLT domain protein [Methylorubrum zatmanii]KQP99085.1 transglycosylase SLT domain protein [Methylobacterium sp. Leaf121]SOR29935.1 putative transglycosylase [Methylorubrum extorquens]